MADANGNTLKVGDRVLVVNMDDPVYKHLEGVTGTVDHIPPEADGPSHDSQVIIVLDHPSVFGVSTQQAWVRKIPKEESNGHDG
jgi:hypothetical protein